MMIDDDAAGLRGRGGGEGGEETGDFSDQTTSENGLPQNSQ